MATSPSTGHGAGTAFQVPLPLPGATCLIPLTRGQCTIVDAADYPDLSRYRWHVVFNPDRGTYYAVRNVYRADGTVEKVWMHRAIMQAPPGQQVDHANRDTLDNRCARCDRARLEESPVPSLQVTMRSRLPVLAVLVASPERAPFDAGPAHVPLPIWPAHAVHPIRQHHPAAASIQSCRF
jgi:hypothetical protein